MSFENTAVNNTEFEIEVTPSAIPSPTIATPNNGTATPVAPAKFGSGDCKIIEDNKCTIKTDKILVDKITQKGIAPSGTKDDFSCTPLSVSPYVFSLPGFYTMLSTSLKALASGKIPMRENDSTTINCTCAGNDSTTPTPVAFTGSCSIKITKAGQEVHGVK